MAKKRYVSYDIVFSEAVGQLSDFGERTFTRILASSDDFGVVPPTNQICQRIGYEADRKQKFPSAWKEIVEAGLLIEFEFEGKRFFMFKPDSFDDTQTQITNRRRSEFTGIRAKKREEFDKLITYITPYKNQSKMRPEKKEEPQIIQEESVSEKAFRLIRQIRATEEEPGLITQFEESWFRGYCNLHGDKVLKAIERLAKIGWRCTPDQVEKTVIGKIDPETIHERSNGQAPSLPIRKELRQPAVKEPQKEGVPMPDEVKNLIEGLGMKFSGKNSTSALKIPQPEPESPKIEMEALLSEDEIVMLKKAEKEAKERVMA